MSLRRYWGILCLSLVVLAGCSDVTNNYYGIGPKDPPITPPPPPPPPPPTPVSSIAITPKVINGNVGDKVQITATVIVPSGKSNKVLWHTSSVSTALVDSTGLVTLVATGGARIIARLASDTSKADTAVVTSNARVVLGIKMSPDSVRVKVGETKELTVTVIAGTGISKDFTCASTNSVYVTVVADLAMRVCRVRGIASFGTPFEVYAQTQAIDLVYGQPRSGSRIYIDP